MEAIHRQNVYLLFFYKAKSSVKFLMEIRLRTTELYHFLLSTGFISLIYEQLVNAIVPS